MHYRSRKQSFDVLREGEKNMFSSENGMSEEINIMSRFLYIIMCNNLTTTEFRLIALSPREVISFWESDLHAAEEGETLFFAALL